MELGPAAGVVSAVDERHRQRQPHATDAPRPPQSRLLPPEGQLRRTRALQLLSPTALVARNRQRGHLGVRTTAIRPAIHRNNSRAAQTCDNKRDSRDVYRYYVACGNCCMLASRASITTREKRARKEGLIDSWACGAIGRHFEIYAEFMHFGMFAA